MKWWLWPRTTQPQPKSPSVFLLEQQILAHGSHWPIEPGGRFLDRTQELSGRQFTGLTKNQMEEWLDWLEHCPNAPAHHIILTDQGFTLEFE